jgi:lysophospholipase L1-like esterase
MEDNMDRPPWFKALLGVAIATLCLGAGEGVARLLTEEVDLLFAWEHPDGLIRVLGDQVYVREKVSHEMTDGPYTWAVQTNDLGLRESAEISAQIPEGSVRVLALGDSWIFGTSVNQGHTISDGIERVMGDLLGQQVEVVNAGIPGASAFEMLARWSELRGRMDFDHLVFGVPHNVHRQLGFAVQRAAVRAPGDGAPYISARLYLLARRVLAPWTRPAYAERDQGVDGIDGSTLHDISTMVRQAQDLGMGVWGVEWPHNMKYAVNTVNPPATQWRKALAPMGVVFSGHALNTRACWGYTDHGHPSEAGAMAIATVVGAVIAGGEAPKTLQTQPRCEDVVGVGPGKPGSPGFAP